MSGFRDCFIKSECLDFGPLLTCYCNTAAYLAYAPSQEEQLLAEKLGILILDLSRQNLIANDDYSGTSREGWTILRLRQSYTQNILSHTQFMQGGSDDLRFWPRRTWSGLCLSTLRLGQSKLIVLPSLHLSQKGRGYVGEGVGFIFTLGSFLQWLSCSPADTPDRCQISCYKLSLIYTVSLPRQESQAIVHAIGDQSWRSPGGVCAYKSEYQVQLHLHTEFASLRAQSISPFCNTLKTILGHKIFSTLASTFGVPALVLPVLSIRLSASM